MMITTRGVEGTAPRVFHGQNPLYGSMYKSYLRNVHQRGHNAGRQLAFIPAKRSIIDNYRFDSRIAVTV